MYLVPNEDLALTFFNWVVMSAERWSFLKVEVVALVEGSAEAGSEGWPAGGWLGGTSWPAGGVGSGD